MRGKSFGLWGAVNQSMELVIPHQFTWLGNFSEGMMIFREAGLYGYWNDKGVRIIAPQFEDINIFHEDVAPVKIKTSYGYIDKEGSVVIDKEFNVVAEVSGFNHVSLSWDCDILAVAQGGKYGFVDFDGRVLLPIEYDASIRFKEMIGSVKRSSKWAFLRWDHQKIERITGFEFEYASIFKEGYAVCSVDSVYRFLKSDGVLTNQSYTLAQDFCCGLAAVCRPVNAE